MCGPAALLPLTIASGVASAGGHILSAAQTAATARYQAQVSERNAQLTADQQAMAANNARTEQQRFYRQLGQREGAQRAAMAANGVDLSFGSALQVQQDTAMLGAEDAEQLHRQAAQTDLGYDITAANQRAQAQGYRQQAAGAWAKLPFDMAGDILGTATQYSSIKTQMSGGFGGSGKTLSLRSIR